MALDNNYYRDNSDLKSQIQYFDYKFDSLDFEFKTDSGVFAKSYVDYATEILLKNAQISQKSTVLDVGCGYGVIGIVLAKKDMCIVDMVDINERAISLAKENSTQNNVTTYVYKSDCLDNVKGKYDFIISNPPIRAGKNVIYKIYEQAKEHLNEGGSFYIVIQKKHGAPSTFEKLKTIYEKVDVVYKKKGYFVIKSS